MSRRDELQQELTSAERRFEAFDLLMANASSREREEYAAAKAELEPYIAGLRRKLEACGADLIADLHRSRHSHVLYVRMVREQVEDATLESYQRDFAIAEVSRVEAYLREVEAQLLERGIQVTPLELPPEDDDRRALEQALGQANFEAHSANHLRHLLRWQQARGDEVAGDGKGMIEAVEAQFRKAVDRYNDIERQLELYDQRHNKR